MRDHVSTLIRSLEIPGAPLSLGEGGVCSLLVDGDLECNLELDELEEWLYLHAPLVRPPAEGLTEFYARLLHANCFGVGTDGGQLGLCERSGAIVYSRRCRPEGLSDESFRDEFDQFVAVALVLRDDFSIAHTATTPTDGDAGNAPPPAFPMEMLQLGFRV